MDVEEYEVIFIVNVIEVVKFVGELYVFIKGMKLVLMVDNYNFINGFREFVGRKGSSIVYIFFLFFDMRINDEDFIKVFLVV